MITNSTITVFHYDSTKDRFVKTFSADAWVYIRSSRAVVNRKSIEASFVRIRIPIKMHDVLSVSSGDYVFVGDNAPEELVREDCFKVLGVAKYSFGLNPHLKIEAR